MESRKPQTLTTADISYDDMGGGTNTRLVTALRVTAEGNAYILQYSLYDSRKIYSREEAYSENENDLYIYTTESLIGEDTRNEITDTMSGSYRKIGEFDYQDYYEGGCSGSVVGSDFVLTAAHCIYDFPNGQFTNAKTFNPARYNDGNGGMPEDTLEPYGQFEVDSWMIYSEYSDYGSPYYDIALVKLKPIDGKSIGEIVGTMKMVDPNDGIDKETADVVGYPADKMSGTMWSSGIPCGDWVYSTTNSFRIKHTCDTYGGQSGAPMFDTADDTVFGVHTHGDDGSGYNQGTALNAHHMGNLEYWMETM